jgi:hypothetical protein
MHAKDVCFTPKIQLPGINTEDTIDEWLDDDEDISRFISFAKRFQKRTSICRQNRKEKKETNVLETRFNIIELKNNICMYICIRYTTIDTKEADRIGYNGFRFPHSYSGEGRSAYGFLFPHEYSCESRGA